LWKMTLQDALGELGGSDRTSPAIAVSSAGVKVRSSKPSCENLRRSSSLKLKVDAAASKTPAVDGGHENSGCSAQVPGYFCGHPDAAGHARIMADSGSREA
ncbi:MAG: hypothetical protein ACRDHY_17810, partial [Anaerolineales bacterium]